jgi:hypothetical protein
MRRLSSKYVWTMLIIIVGWGTFLRFWNLGARPFWCDEAWVALAVRDLSYASLLTQGDVPLPPLFAVAVKLFGNLPTAAEFAYRLLPALSGVLLLPLMYVAVRILRLPRTLAVAGVGLCASSIMLAIWSRELKQYSFEALLSVVMACLVFQARRCHSASCRWASGAAIVIVCLLGPWFGYGAVFPLCVLAAMLIVLRPERGPRRATVAIGLAGLLALTASVLSLRQLAAGEQARDPSLVQYTRPDCIQPLDLRSWARAASSAATSSMALILPPTWLLSAGAGTRTLGVGIVALLVWFVALLGLAAWPRRSRVEMAGWVLGPWLAMLGAALAQQYPFGVARMVQFWAAPMILAVSAGLLYLWRGVYLLVVGRAGPALVPGMFLGLVPALYVIGVPLEHRYYPVQDAPALLRTLEEQRGPDELVLVHLLAVPPVRYYRPDLPPPVVYTPIAAGFVRVVGHDYAALTRHTARRAGQRWYVLTANAPATRDHYRRMLDVIGQEGYAVELVARGGAMELLVATRRGR